MKLHRVYCAACGAFIALLRREPPPHQTCVVCTRRLAARTDLAFPGLVLGTILFLSTTIVLLEVYG